MSHRLSSHVNRAKRHPQIDRIDHKEPDFVISEKIGRQDVIHDFRFKTDGQELIDRNGINEVSRKAHWEGNGRSRHG